MPSAVPGNVRGLTHDRRRIPQAVRETWLYVPCWGTGELKQYDVSDPAQPQKSGRGPTISTFHSDISYSAARRLRA
jgi:hypothetical protein